MEQDAPGAVVLVDRYVEEAVRVARPDSVAGRVLDTVDKVLARGEVADADGEKLGALVVGAPSNLAMIRRMSRVEKVKKGLAGRQGVAVDQHSLLAAGARRAAENSMLPAMTIAGVIGVGAVRLRRLAVVLFEAGAHFADKFAPKHLERSENIRGISVFGVEMAADWLRQAPRVAQDFAPILRPEPSVIVNPFDAMGRTRLGPFLRPGRIVQIRLGGKLRHCPFEHGARLKPQVPGVVHPPILS